MNVAKGVFQSFQHAWIRLDIHFSEQDDRLLILLMLLNLNFCASWKSSSCLYSNALHELYSSLRICNPFGFQLVYLYLLYSPICCSYQLVQQQCHRRRSKRTNWRVPSWDQHWWKRPSKTSLTNWLTSSEANRIFARRCWSLWIAEIWSTPRKSNVMIVFLRLGPSSPFFKNIHSIDQWWMSSAGFTFSTYCKCSGVWTSTSWLIHLSSRIS